MIHKRKKKHNEHHHLKKKKIPNLKVEGGTQSMLTVQWDKRKSYWIRRQGGFEGHFGNYCFLGFDLPGLFLAQFGLLCDRKV